METKHSPPLVHKLYMEIKNLKMIIEQRNEKIALLKDKLVKINRIINN